MSGNADIEKGDTVAWNWGGSSIQGEVEHSPIPMLQKCAHVCAHEDVYCTARWAVLRLLWFQVTEKHTEHAEIKSKGKTITRNGDEENPAYKVERPGKNPVLKKVTRRAAGGIFAEPPKQLLSDTG
jgi:hypothetical protein